MKQYWRFNVVCTAAILSGLSIVGLFNLIVDPYSVTGAPTFAWLNKQKPVQRSHVRLFKAVQSARLKPKAVFLGTSTVDRGLDPQHASVSNYQPAYNLGLLGANLYEQRRYLEHVLANQKELEVVILGLDLFSFNVGNEVSADFNDDRMGKGGLYTRDLLNVTLSLDALQSSFETWKSNASTKNTYAHFYLENGMNTWEEFARVRSQKLVKGDGDRSIHTIFEEYTSQHFSEEKYLKYFKLSQERLNDLRAIVDLCDRHDIKLKVFISPSHVTYSETAYVTGLWTAFEEWKREIVNIVPVWDFSGYNSITTEPIANDMRNYYDSVHYTKFVGDLILKRLMGSSEESVPKDFGVLLNDKNVEMHIEQTRAEREAWVARNPEVVEFVRSLRN